MGLLLCVPSGSCRKAGVDPPAPAVVETESTFVAKVLRSSLPAHLLESGAYERWPAGSVPSRVLVVAHSFTDRTHLVGREAARMLGATYIRLFQPPGDSEVMTPVEDVPAGVEGQGVGSFQEAVKAISEPEVSVLFLGSPIWGNPTPLVIRLVEKASLDGKLVVPFCTHAQQWHPERFEPHLKQLRDLGARVAMPWVLRLPFHMSEGEIYRAVWASLPARRDLWWNRETPEASRCDPGEAGGPAIETCRVPAGLTWTWTPAPVRPGSTVYERAPRLAATGAFEIARREVSLDLFVGGKRKDREAPTKVWIDTCKALVAEGGDRPLPCVSLEEAQGWCEARGMRLPTLSEWSRAARGDSSQPFPWGSSFAFDGSLGNFGEGPGNGRVEAGCRREGADFRGDGFPGLAPPCSFPAGDSRHGACDMAGNLAEWVLATTPGGEQHGALAGGNWFDCVPEAWRVDRPVWFPARMTFDGVGFRCVAGERRQD